MSPSIGQCLAGRWWGWQAWLLLFRAAASLLKMDIEGSELLALSGVHRIRLLIEDFTSRI
jgi:hypothetical protein